MNTQKPSIWKKYFSGKNLFINLLLIIIPAGLTIGITKEVLKDFIISPLIYTLIQIGILYCFIHLVGLIREDSLNKKDAFKNISRFYVAYFIILFIFIFIYSSEKSKKTIITKDLEVDKVELFSEINENIYRDTKHNFSIKFPKGWKIESVNLSDTTQRAVSGGNSISIDVKESVNEYIDQKMTIKDILSLEDFKNLYSGILIEKYPRLKLLDHGETELDGIPTYYIKFNTPYTSENLNSEYTSILYQLVHKKIYYSITVVSPTDDFDSMKETLNQSVNTFVIEDDNQ